MSRSVKAILLAVVLVLSSVHPMVHAHGSLGKTAPSGVIWCKPC